MALPLLDVDKRGGDFAPVSELQCTLAEAAAGNHGDGIGGAAVDFHKSNQTLAVLATGIVNAELRQAEHGQPHAQDLTGAKVSVRLFGVAQDIRREISFANRSQSTPNPTT